MNINFSDTVTE